MRSLLAVTVAASVALWSSFARAQCTKDTECKGERICNQGVCQTALAAQPLVAPARASTAVAPAARARRRSTGLMVGGIVLASLGTASLATALGLTIAQVSCDDDAERARCRAFDTAALATLLAGFGATSIGIPLIVYGAKKLPLEGASAALAPWLTPSAAGLSLRLRLRL
jgi:hypothetical protein